ncbi:MAG: hypothetical protein CMP65_05655 [Flavobacteriales bacterium]|nr:hypothetical protein [Flavobacteriales bacterium]|tara:strand:+ start:11228 stop:11521 length:294 start_codon:yes stop_codon:yes gene_type:complete
MYASFPVPKKAQATTNYNIENVVVSDDLIESPSPAPAPGGSIDWGLAAICFFVGALGIHRFVMGDTLNGILMLLTAGGCGIWALIDFIRILSGTLGR